MNTPSDPFEDEKLLAQIWEQEAKIWTNFIKQQEKDRITFALYAKEWNEILQKEEQEQEQEQESDG